MPTHRAWTEAEEIQLLILYADAQLSLSEIAEQLGRSGEATEKKARALGLWKRHRNATIDRRYFQAVSTPQQAYFLGLLAADGSVSSTRFRYNICLALKRSDEDLVARFRDAVAPDALLSYDRHLVRVRVGCKEMVADLAAYNIVPRKSYSFDWPLRLAAEMAMPFLLGYFDGDGCLSVHASGRIQWTLLGCENFLWEARDRIAQWSGVTVSFPAQSDRRVKHLYRIDAMSDKAIAIDKALNASELGLPRKHLQAVLGKLPVSQKR
jgi:hypothetical protein